MIPTPASLRCRQHLLERLQAKAVEDDLHARHTRPRDRAQRLLAGLHRDAVGADVTFLHELVEGIEDRVVLVHLVGRAVQLHEVDSLDPEVRARARVPSAERFAVVVLRQLLDPPAHLRRDEHLWVASRSSPQNVSLRPSP